MPIRQLIYSPFVLSLIAPLVLSFPLSPNGGLEDRAPSGTQRPEQPASITEILTTPTPAVELKPRSDGNCIVFVNARDADSGPASCASHANTNTVRDLPTHTEIAQMAIVTPTVTAIPEAPLSEASNDRDGEQQGEVINEIHILPISKRQDEEPDPDCPRCPYVNAKKRSPQDETDDSEEGVVPTLGNSRVSPFINARAAQGSESTDLTVKARAADGETIDEDEEVHITPREAWISPETERR